MKCTKCGSDLPDDSLFCQFCGEKLEIAPKAPITPNTDATQKNLSCGKQHFRLSYVIVPLACIAIIGLIMLSIYQNLEIQELNDKVQEEEKLVTTLKDESAQYEKVIAHLEKSEVKANQFLSIVSAAKKGNLGYASDNFKASESVIVVRKSETNRQFKLTAYWKRGGTVEIDYDSSPKATVWYQDAADLSFEKDNWNSSVNMTVNPNYVGTTIATFSNDVNDETFKIIIIVTE